MADDQVKYSDLFESGIDAQVKALTEEIKSLRDAISAAKDEAQGMKKELSSMGTATREQQQAVSTQAAAIEKLQKQAKDLTEQEAKAVKFLADSLNFMNQNGTKNMNVWKNMTQSMDGFNMSYNQMKETVKVLESALKSLNSEQQRNSEGAKSAAAAVARLKEAMQAFDAQTKTAKGNVEKTSRAYAKLTDEEIQSLNQLKTALQGTAQEQMAAVQAIDIQAKSYNELYQTYNAIKDVLNAMTVAERENTEEGKMMVNRAKEIRDTLNNLQQQTGNYTLNVGNYMSAMTGLQMQTQQILREIPSALNLQQFFLAISNNVPMFTDALARYNKGLPEIKAKLAAVTAEITRQEAALAGMNAQSTEYAAKQAQINELRRQEQQLQSASVGGWRAILKSVGSWQTLLIAGLLLLRKIPDIVKAISKWWDRWRNGVKEIKNEVGAIGAMARLQADVIKKTADEVTELQLVLEKLRDVKQGTDEWAAGVRTVNEITKSTLDVTKATPEEVQKVTDAYIRQANQLAKNAVLSDMIGKSMANQSLRDVAYHPGTYGTARQALGLDIGSKDEKEFGRLFMTMNQAIQDYNNKVRRTEWASVRDAAGNKTMRRVEENENLAANRRRKEMNDAIQDYRNFINKRLEVLSPEAVKKLQEQYELIDPMGSGSDGNSNSKPSEQKVTERYWEAQEATLRAQYEGYALERALAKMNHDKALAEQKSWYTEQQKNLEENVKNGFITREEAGKVLAELDRQNTDIEKGIERQYWEDLRALRMKNLADRKKEWKANADEVEKNAKDNAKRELKAAVDGWAEYKAKMVEEGKTRKQIVEAEVAAEIARLNLMLELNRDVNGEIMSDEQKAKVQEWINLLERLQQTGNYGDYKPGQFIGKGGANVTNERKNYANIWEVLGIDMDNNQVSALNSVFDQAKEALNSWMDARKAAADQAKELADDEVSAAENALNREIELRNQGYANDVALREKELADAKEQQKKALEMQQKAKEEELAINTALEASNMAVAIANLIKQFGWWSIPMIGVMLGAWGAAKASAFNQIRSTKYREGGVMLLEGGSHESGHDVNLGIGPDGSNLRAEGGEYFAVINKRSSRKYGSQIPAVVNALNSGMFEDRYIKTSDAMGLMGNVGVVGNVGESADLSRLESGVGELVKQGEQNWTIEGDYRVLRYKNLTRRVKIG